MKVRFLEELKIFLIKLKGNKKIRERNKNVLVFYFTALFFLNFTLIVIFLKQFSKRQI